MKLCGKAGKLHLLHCKRNIPLMLLEWVFKSTRKTSNDFSYDLRSKVFLINQTEACNTVDPLYNILCFGVPPPQLQFVAFKWLPSNFVLTYKNFVLCTFSKKKKKSVWLYMTSFTSVFIVNYCGYFVIFSVILIL